MNIVAIFLWANLFFNGMLAGEELAVYYGVRIPVASLEERPQTLLRQALIRRLRLFGPWDLHAHARVGGCSNRLGRF